MATVAVVVAVSQDLDLNYCPTLSLKSSGGRLRLSFVSCICILHTPHAYEVYSTNRLRYMYMMYVCCRVALMQPEMELTSALGRTRR